MHAEKLKSFAIAMVTALGILLGVVPIASAQNIQCTGAIQGTTIDGNLTVPTNANCTLLDVTVNGNVRVGTGASLRVEPPPGRPVTINGNLTADQCNFVVLVPFSVPFMVISVAGNVNLQNCGLNNEVDFVTIAGNFVCANNPLGCGARGSVVQGNLTVDGNSRAVDVVGNQVSGNVDVSGNSGSAPVVEDNTIGGNLKCFDNNPSAVDLGFPNTVGGHKQGQCAGL